jgi:uncharacterized LabA/DUF88 family protein
MDIELAVDAMEFAENIGQMVPFSGDGDFRFLVEAAQRRVCASHNIAFARFGAADVSI